jgi:hypothetical protein
MTNTERIQANNAELREAIEMAEKLPEASTSVEAILQSKVVIPSKIAQEITADVDYTALEKVTVEAIPDEYIVPSGTNNITENGTHDVTEYAAVKVAVPTGEDVTAETDEYTAKLATLETAITALETELEGKAAGGVATCTIEIINETIDHSLGTHVVTLYYVAHENGEYKGYGGNRYIENGSTLPTDFDWGSEKHVLNNVVCGSMIYIEDFYGLLLYPNGDWYIEPASSRCFGLVPSTPNATHTIKVSMGGA